MCSNKSTQGAERGQNQIKHDSSNVVRKNNTKAKNKKMFAKVFLTSISFTLWHSKQVWHKKMSASGKEASCYSITQFFFMHTILTVSHQKTVCFCPQKL